MSGQDDETAELVARFRLGDEEALRSLIGLHKEALYRFIYRCLGDRGESDELLSQVFIRAWNSRKRYRPGRALFSTWLFTIATNLCRDHGRKKKRHPADFAAMKNHDDNALLQQISAKPDLDTPSGKVVGREEVALLQQAISELPHLLRATLILHALECYSQKETARCLGCSVKAVESRISRARKLLREKLRD